MVHHGKQAFLKPGYAGATNQSVVILARISRFLYIKTAYLFRVESGRNNNRTSSCSSGF